MEPSKVEREIKLPNMIMCGDHPSLTKAGLNAKEVKVVESKEKDKEKERKTASSFPRLSPSSSRTEKLAESERVRARVSELALQAHSLAKRRLSADALRRPDCIAAQGNRELVQAALGSFRWPPYLVCVWVVVLVLTHALHCLVAMLDKALPTMRKVCQYFRNWTEGTWRGETDLNNRIYPILLACATALLYTLYTLLVCMHALVLWAVEPLYGESEEKDEAPKITNYDDDFDSQITSSKQ